jgi:HK97 family phage major capsid protein
MYTLARIYDISKQFLRKSAGAAEADVMEELGSAFARGTAHYIREGSGTSEPYGLQTALATMPQWTVAHTPTAATLAGSVARAIAACAGALAQRGRTGGISAVMSGTAYGEMLQNGADTSGFYLANAVEGSAFSPGTLVSPWGIPVYVDTDLAADDLIVGQFGSLVLYVGEGYRVDTTDVAGERWDRNLVGFRGEMELGCDARPAVYAGAFCTVADILS